MKLRLKFLPSKQKEFLSKIATKSRLLTSQLAKMAGVTPRSYFDWRREKLNMPLEMAKDYSEKFKVPLPEPIEKMSQRWISLKREINKKGGIARYKKYGNFATTDGRKRGGAKALKILREKGIIPLFKKYHLPKKYSEQLAELVGILLGDGGITPGQVFITLNGEADRDYVNFVIDLENRLFKEKPKIIKKNNDKAVAIYLNGIQLINYLVSIGLKIGNKVKQQVGVPNWIISSKTYKIACLRGLMDTDGGVFLHKYKVNGKDYVYKKICFSNRSLPLLYFVEKTLKNLGFTPKIITKVENKKVWLYNKNEVERYLRIIGTHNSRLLKHEEGVSHGLENGSLNHRGETR